MDLTLLRSFLAVVEHGGVTEAAYTLAVSQSALSRRLALLNEEFGAALFERAGRGVVLTPLGRLVASEAQGLVQRYDGIKRQVRDHLELQAGIVRIGGGATAVAFLLPEQIAAFRERYPKIVFQLKEAGSQDTEEAVLRGDLDLGVVTLPVRSQELVVRPWVKDRIVLVGSKLHRLSQKRRVSSADLEGETFVGFEAGTAVRRLVDRELGAAAVHVNVAMELRSVAAILQMVDATQSLAFVSELALGQGRKAIAVQGLDIERQLALVWRSDRALPSASEHFCELLAPIEERKHDAKTVNV